MEYSNYEKVNIAANKISSKTERLIFLLEQLSLWERNKPTRKQDPICNFENVYDRTIRLIKCDINTLELTLKYTTKQQSISSQQLKTKLTDTQLNTLADELINKGFIASTDKDCFVWAFGGKNDINTFTQIKWLKKKNLCVYLIDNIAYDAASPLPIWEIGSNIFDIQSMAQIKDRYLNNKKRDTPVNSEIIDKIITTAREAK